MKLLAVAFLLLLVQGVYSNCCCRSNKGDIEKLIKPCYKGDTAGFRELVKSFLEVVTIGLPDYNVQSLEPMVFPFLKLQVNKGVVFYFTWLVIRNLSNVDIYNSILDTKANTTEIELKLNLNMTANVAIVLNDGDNEVAVGNIPFCLKTNIMPCTTKYGFKAAPNKKGVTYFTVLQEKTKCCVINDVTMTFSPSLDELFKDEDLKMCNVHFDKHGKKWKNKLAVQIVKLVIARLIDNFRIACRLMPASKYIKDIDC